jgi:hypothetical protein
MEHPEAGKSLISQLQQARDDPGTGDRIKGIEIIPKLRGMLYKARVGGRRKFRLFYYHHAGRAVVMPVYLSHELRGSFDYSDVTPLVDAAVVIVADFEAKHWERFIEPTFAR